AVLLHAHFEVLEEALRAILAARIDPLLRGHRDLPRLADADDRRAGDVAHAQARHLVELELAGDGLVERIAARVAHEVLHASRRDAVAVDGDVKARSGRAPPLAVPRALGAT